MAQYTQSQVALHNQYGDLWVIINDNVYDLSKFADVHPAGRNVLKDYAGKDVTELFNRFHSQAVLSKYHEKLLIGTVSDPKAPQIIPLMGISKDNPAYGDMIPHGDPMNAQGWYTPYYKQSHRKLRIALKQFLQKEIAPNMDTWDSKKILPREVIRRIAEVGILGIIVGQPWPEKYFPNKKILDVEIKKPDYFHELITIEEVIKHSNIGLAWAIGTCSIGLPPIINHGSEYLKDRYISQVLNGEKMICLAITEPWAGSDVANVQCKAELTDDGKFYIVNGMKKFITTGEFADIFTTAVRTGGEGFFGVSLLAIERTMPGVKTRKMNMQGVWGSGTAFIIYENVKVPVEQLIGEEGMGFMYIMQNFNHERFQIAVKTVAGSRCIYEECMKYANSRDTFGKKLIEQPVIRQKLAGMIKEIEPLQAYLELIAYNMQNMSKKQEKVVAAAIAIAKSQGTLIFEKIAGEGIQVFGGNGYQRGSVGSKIERFYRECKSLTLGGGTPEIMFDMAIRQSSRLMPKPKM